MRETTHQRASRSIRGRASAGAFALLVLTAVITAGLLAGPASASARFTFKSQAHFQDNCERAGGKFERMYDGPKLTGFRCSFKSGDQIFCDKTWANPDNCVHLPKPGGMPNPNWGWRGVELEPPLESAVAGSGLGPQPGGMNPGTTAASG
jgi:hypothetical protein